MISFLVFGAGKSSVYLIEYLNNYCLQNQLNITVCDKNTATIESIINKNESLNYKNIDIFETESVLELIKYSQIVVSLLPANLHIHIAKMCLELGKHFCSASYISEEMMALNDAVKQKKLIFLNEIGLDPGIDHISAMKIFDEIRIKGGVIKSFKSFCGGLVADECDGDNPWKYKFTWNPTNVVLAGQGNPAIYKQNNKLKIRPYQQLFKKVYPFKMDAISDLEGYPNRDSLKYIDAYKLHNIDTMIRGTLRKIGYSEAWNVLVNIGLTDNSLILNMPKNTSIKQWVEMYLPLDFKELPAYFDCSQYIIEKLNFIGFNSDEKLGVLKGTSAQILEEVLTRKWQLLPEDKDLIVMIHDIDYEFEGKTHNIKSNLVLKGESSQKTAMAKTVGLPLAISAKLIFENKITSSGVLMPLKEEFYNPILKELAQHQIIFKEIETIL